MPPRWRACREGFLLPVWRLENRLHDNRDPPTYAIVELRPEAVLTVESILLAADLVDEQLTAALIEHLQKKILQSLSIISSARMSSRRGTVIRRVRAVLLLITSSNLVGSRIGNSAGAAPCRIRPA